MDKGLDQVSDAPKRPPIDWEAIEREYRAGQLSVSEIARQHSVSHPLIFRKAKAVGWTRNLADRVREAVTAKAVTDGVTGDRRVTDREAVELAAERGVQIVREHRTLIGRGRALVAKMFGELDAAGTGEDGSSLKDKSMTLGNLTNSLKTLVALERQAFSLSDDPAKEPRGFVVELVDYDD